MYSERKHDIHMDETSCVDQVLPVGNGPFGASEVRGFLQTKQFQEIIAKVLKVNKWNNACMGLAGNRLFRVSISI